MNGRERPAACGREVVWFDVQVDAHDLAVGLPDPEILRSRCRGLAMVEAIVNPSWEARYYSYDTAWGPGQEMASMRNGSGDDYFIVFTPAGVFLRGFDHESPMSPARSGRLWPGLVERLPTAFEAQANEPAFSYRGQLNATFVLWREIEDDRWRTGVTDLPLFSGYRVSPDGSEMMAILLDDGPDGYLAFAADCYETALDPLTVGHVLALRPLNDEVVAALNPELRLADLGDEIRAIGYPIDRFDEFARLVEAARTDHLRKGYPPEIQLFELLAASDEDFAAVEAQLDVILPASYKHLMKRYGGGMFGFVDLLPVRSAGRPGGDLLSENSGDGSVAGFVAIAPGGSGDMWGFVARQGRCTDAVSLWDHETGRFTPAADDFLEFLTARGLPPARG